MTSKQIAKLKRLLNALGGYGLNPYDPAVGPRTDEAIDNELKKHEKTPPPTVADQPQNPAYIEAKKYKGKSESDKAWVAWLSKFWPKVGLPNFKTIVGASFAWCGLFIAAMNTQVGYDIVSGAAGAKNWAKYGQAIEWKKDGVPRGAVLHINNGGNCSSGSNNHVTFADGDCTASDLLKPGGVVPGYGGNQANSVKRSLYAASKICAVRWPAEIPKPGPVKISKDCSGTASSSESTR